MSFVTKISHKGSMLNVCNLNDSFCVTDYAYGFVQTKQLIELLDLFQNHMWNIHFLF